MEKRFEEDEEEKFIEGEEDGELVEGEEDGKLVEGEEEGTLVKREEDGNLVEGEEEGKLIEVKYEVEFVNNTESKRELNTYKTTQIKQNAIASTTRWVIELKQETNINDITLLDLSTISRLTIEAPSIKI